MKKIIAVSLLCGALALHSVSLVQGQAPVPPTPPPALTSPLAPTPDPNQPNSLTPNGPHFFNGESIVISEELTGDVYVSGGSVRIDGKVNGDILAAGGQVILNAPVTEDVRVAGGTVEINSQIGQDLTAFGGTVVLGRTASVGGSLIAGGGSLRIDGEVKGNTFLGGGTTQLAGKMGDDVVFGGGNLSVLSTAAIAGDLQVMANVEPDIVEGAHIQGETKVTLKDELDGQGGRRVRPIGNAILISTLITTIISFISAALLLFLFPRVAESASNNVLTQPLASLGWGLVDLFLIPIVVFIMMITVVGLPLGLITLFAYIIGLLLANWVAAYAIGKRLYQASQPEPGYGMKLLQLLLGLVILGVVTLIPVAGWIVRFVVFVMGLGGLFIGFKLLLLNTDNMVMAPAIVPVTETSEERELEAIIPYSQNKSRTTRGKKRRKVS